MTELSPSSSNKSDNKLKIQTARDKLKAYYGLQNSNNNEIKTIASSGSNNNVGINLSSVEIGTSATPGGIKLDNLIKQGIDDPEFNPAPFLNQILKNCPLQTILHLNNQWVNDIKQLDGDKNNLIYNNYNKFIFATQAIGELKTSLDTILPNLSEIDKSIGVVGNNLIKLGETLEPTRVSLKEAYTTNKLLKKSEFLLNLPKSLDYLLKTKNYTSLLEQLNLTKSSLEKYKDLQLFESISRECEAIRVRVEIELKEELENSKDNIETTSKLINLLISLNPAQTEHWFNYYLTHSKSYLKSIQQANIQSQADSNQFEDSLTQLDNFILPNLALIIDSFSLIFLDKARKDYLKVCISTEDKQKYCEKFKKFASTQYNEYYSNLFTNLTKSNELDLILNLFNNHLTKLNSVEIIVNDQLVNIRGKFNNLIINWYEDYLNQLIKTTLNELKVKFTTLFELESINLTYTLTNIPTLDNFALQSKLILAENTLLEVLIQTLLPKLKLLVLNREEFWKLTNLGSELLELLKFKFFEFWLSVENEMIEDLITKSDPKNLNLILIICKLTHDSYLNLIETIYLTYIQSLIQDNPLIPLISLNEETLMKSWIASCRELSQIYQKKSKGLLNRFCINYGQYLVGEVVNYYDNGKFEGVGVDEFDPIFLDILVKFHLLEREICIIFDINYEGRRDTLDNSNSLAGFGDYNYLENNKRASFNRSSFQSTIGAGGLNSPSYRNSFALPTSPNFSNQGSSASNDQHHNLLTKINRLFYERIEYYPKETAFNLKEILNNIVNILLKGFCEFIRTQHWGVLNLTKVNLNLVNLKLNLPAVIINSNNFNNLIEETNNSLVKRSLSQNFNSSSLNYQNLDNLLNTIYSKDTNWLYLNERFEFIPVNSMQVGVGKFGGIVEED